MSTTHAPGLAAYRFKLRDDGRYDLTVILGIQVDAHRIETSVDTLGDVSECINAMQDELDHTGRVTIPPARWTRSQ